MTGDSVDVKDELRFSHPVVDEAGRGLVEMGDSATTNVTDGKTDSINMSFRPTRQIPPLMVISP